MGQKTNPIGLRVGVSRKWTSSWISQGTHQKTITVQKSSDSAQTRHTLLSQGVISARGGFLSSSLENIIRSFISKFPFFYNNESRNYIPISIQYIKGGQNHLFIFFSYVKLIGRRKKAKLSKKN